MTAFENIAPVLLSNRYRVINVLGDGGFGKTFLVEDTQMPSNRRCVLKQLKPVHDEPETAQMVKDRFQREAAILEKLGEAHEQIPRLYAYFSEGDQFYLVEEWVEGDTLTQRVQREGPLSEQAVQNIVAGLLPAIAHVHSEGIVHRDIKPDNIILSAKDGKPVLIDFGAVKETMNTFINSQANSSHSIVVGTPGYMPAEQLAGRPLFASDIYAIGMSAIYALTGKLPQELDIDPSSGALQWRQHAPNVSTEFANFLDCAIHMNVQSRFANVQAMQSILNNLRLNGMTAAPQPLPETRQSSQTIVSASPQSGSSPSPMLNSDQNITVSPAYAYQGVESAQTQIVSPQTLDQNMQHSGQFASAGAVPAAVPSTAQSQSGQWKNAVIVGGMIGFSVLLGALVVMERLPSAIGGSNNSDTAGESVEVDLDVAGEEEATTPTQTDGEQTSPQNNEANSTSQNNQPAPSTPAPVAQQPTATTPVASVPGANSSIVGQPGSKNVRNGAGTNFSVVDAVNVGDRVKVVARGTDSGGHAWYRIQLPNGNSGWIAGQLIQVDGDAAPPQSIARPQPARPTTPVDRTNATIVGESGSKNIRSGPGTGYGVAHIAYPGDRVIIRQSSQDAGGYTWHKVYFPKSGAEGWIAAQLIKVD